MWEILSDQLVVRICTKAKGFWITCVVNMGLLVENSGEGCSKLKLFF